MSRILVAYATKHGATAEIAERIGQVLRKAGLQADVISADRVDDLTPLRGSRAGQRDLHRSMAQRGSAILEGQRAGAG